MASLLDTITLAERYEALVDRIEARLDKSGDCWLWPGSKTKTHGKLGLWTGEKLVTIYVHRAMYERHVGPIPDGLVLDHLCMVPLCANPAHLEPVTQGENVRRWAATITACLRGHEFTEENTYVNKKGVRHCRTCRRGGYQPDQREE